MLKGNSQRSKKETKPNVLFIFTDEQRFDTMRCYGNDRIHTPNLNALAEQSVVFENCYVTQSVCTPSRSSIMTGLWPHTNGCTENNIPLRNETQTIAEMISNDYRCGYYGKWHLGDEIIAQHGFEDWVSIEYYRRYYSKQDYLSRLPTYHQFLVENGYAPNVEALGTMGFSRTMAANLPERFTKASFLGHEASRFIRENCNRPFVLYVNFLEPHMPFTGPFNDMYPPEAVPTGTQFLNPPSDSASRYHWLMAEHYLHSQFEGHDLRTESGWKKLRAQYWGLITLVDRAVGRILQALEETGQADNTIVVFTSDHGDMMGDHGILAKCVMYEEALKVPLLIRVPWQKNSIRSVSGRISQIDLVPTLLELMGESIPSVLQGESRAGVVCGKADLDKNDVFVEWNGRDGLDASSGTISASDKSYVDGQPWRTVVSSDGWKLNLSPVDRCELYNLHADPCEEDNLYNHPNQKDRVQNLTERIFSWQERTKDSVALDMNNIK